MESNLSAGTSIPSETPNLTDFLIFSRILFLIFKPVLIIFDSSTFSLSGVENFLFNAEIVVDKICSLSESTPASPVARGGSSLSARSFHQKQDSLSSPLTGRCPDFQLYSSSLMPRIPDSGSDCFMSTVGYLFQYLFLSRMWLSITVLKPSCLIAEAGKRFINISDNELSIHL